MKTMPLLCLVLFLLMMQTGCGSGSAENLTLEEAVPLWLNQSLCEEGDPHLLLLALEGNHLCQGQTDCERVGGRPDHFGCPNTCGCLCFDNRCYLHSCTAISGCTEPPVFR